MKLSLFKGDLVVWAILFCLCAISIIEVYSAGSYLIAKKGSTFLSPVIEQARTLFLTLSVTFVIHNIPCRYFKLFPVFGLPVSWILLIVTAASGSEINGGARWLNLLGISFQPSELSKWCLIVTIALILASQQKEKGATKSAFWYILIITGITTLFIFLENLSTGILIWAVVVIMMWIGRIHKKQLYIFLAIATTVGGLLFLSLYALPKDKSAPVYEKLPGRFATWRSRIFENNNVIPDNPRDFVFNDSTRQVTNAKIAIASSHGLGVGPGRSVQRDHLSAAYADFIFAIICEEFGLTGCIVVVALYLILFYRTWRIASRCSYNFPAFLVLGLGVMICTQSVMNMLVAVGLAPVTGQPLPIISRGGTSAMIMGGYFGMILSVSRSARRNDVKPLKSLATENSMAVQDKYTQQ